jgi:hypothetical protein
LRTEVVEKGYLVCFVDSYQVGYFEMTTNSMYAGMNEAWTDILKDYEEKYGLSSIK